MYDAREDDDDAISWLITLVSSRAHALSYTLSFSLSLSKATALNTLSRLKGSQQARERQIREEKEKNKKQKRKKCEKVRVKHTQVN